MQWSKPFANILLFIVCVLVIKFSASANRVGNNTRWLKMNFPKRYAEKQHHKTSKRANKPHKLEGSTNSLVLNYPERQKVSKQTSSEFVLFNRRLSRIEANLGEFSNARKRIYKSHRIAKRNVNISEPTQLTATPTSNPPTPSFNNPLCSGQKSCSGRCRGSISEWRTDENLACYCDTACFEIFNDCCTDYTKYCGVQKPSNVSIKQFKWTCEPLGHFQSNQNCEIGEGLWMVSLSADDWPRGDEIRHKCENPSKSIQQVSDIKRFIPAVSVDVIFRNYFCVQCNHVAGDFEYFPVEIKTNIIPPESYNFSQKVNFLLSNGAEFSEGGSARPKSSQARRYCVRGKFLVDYCLDDTSGSCKNGPVGNPFIRLTAQKFLLNLDYKETNNEEDSVFTVLNTSCCSNGLLFDDKLQDCVENFPTPEAIKADKFRILAWFAPSKNSQFTENEFEAVMKQYFGVEGSQIYNISIGVQIDPLKFYLGLTPNILYHLVSSTLLLNPEQSFDVFCETNSSNLRSFINFEKPLSVTIKNITYTVIKTTSRLLSCIIQKVYTPQEYKVLNDEWIYINSTNVTYKKWEYSGQINGNITICEEYSASNCEKTQTGLPTNDFIINTNLSLYQKNTGMLYELGQYDVFNNSIALCNLKKSDIIPTCSSENSCKGRCSNHTEWRNEFKMRCSCDPDCYEVFNDCCADYTKYCGAQKPTETRTKKYHYTCETLGHYDGRRCTVADGLWMVTRCRPEWPNDTFRTKCEAPVDRFTYSSPDLYGYLPVLGHDNTSFRNMYCAICNGVERFDPWPLDTITQLVPPKDFNVTEKIRYLLSSITFFGPWSPGTNQAKRYCMSQVIDSCPPGLGEIFKSCTNGDMALVSKPKDTYHTFNFKNAHCVACHGLPSETFSCFPTTYLFKTCLLFLIPRSFSLVLDHSQVEKEIKTRVSLYYDKECGRSGRIFDDTLQVCRVNWLSPPKQNGQERFYVFVWLEPPHNSQNNAFTPTEFQESIAKYLNVSQLQLLDVNITTLSQPAVITMYFYLVSSTIILTPQQSLELLFINRNGKTQSYETKLLNYIHFSEPFSLQIKDNPYTVTKTTSRPVACVRKTSYTPEEYTLQDQERVYIPSTNKTYEKFEYYRENVEKLDVKLGNITVCEKFIPIKCNGSIVLYTQQEYMVMVNLSIYVNKASSLYNYGEYEILSNKSMTICQKFKVRIITETRQTIRDNEALGYITFISFLFSILFLIFLLGTYTLFPQLRTLPGRNLMNFAASLLLFQIFWLPSNFTEVLSNKPTCMAMTIMEHYFLMASFVSMSVIAFHTFKVFARSLPAPKMSQGRERKLFCTYLALVWLLPGVFVGTCVVLDNQDILRLGYGRSEICWLTENNADTYLVTIPIAVLLLFNIIAFVITAVYIRKHSQNTAARQASGNRRSNLSIYTKLSTLMGLAWLFGLLALVVTSAAVFWYLFVIFTSLQGIFVALAFVVNAKTFNLYKKKYISASSTPAERNVTTNIYNDTTL